VISRKGVCSTLPPIMEALATQVHDRMLLFLPMSNFQQRFLCYAALWYDFEIIITDFTDLFSAMRQLSPTILLAPPVFYQMVHGDFMRQPAWQRWSQIGLGRLLCYLPFSRLRRRLARLLFRDFYRQFGNRIRLLITGMAPIRPNIAEFFSAAQLPLSEAYGMVEASVMAFRPPGSKHRGSVGKPLRGVHFTIAKDNELIVSRDHPLTLRYFQCAEGENERTFLGPGRIATGDIGRFGRSGELFILGRKGEVIVTANGHKLHPEVIENELNSCPDIANSVIFRRPDAGYLSCVISLHDPQDPQARQRVRKFAAALRSTKKASQFVEVIFAEAPFSRENGMLRPNMKIDRKNIVSRYRNVPVETAAPSSLS
jgi:long-subunit acyl-CoA synthetase (AMP-forming)